METKKSALLIQMLVKGLLGFLIMGLLLFGCAGTLHYTNAWLFLITLAVLMLAMGFFLYFKEPETLKRRIKTKETQKAQKGYTGFIGLAFILSFVLAGLDYRFQWISVPFAVSLTGVVFMVVGYMLYAVVILQNTYAARVIEVQQGQHVISTGVYAIIRHPMYLACLLLFLAMPFVLGSYIAVLPLLFLMRCRSCATKARKNTLRQAYFPKVWSMCTGFPARPFTTGAAKFGV